MTVSWRAYRHARRRSRQAWALLAVLALSAVGSAGWFFTAGQFVAAEPAIAGPREAPVFDGTWMKPVIPVHAVPQGSALAALERLSVKGRAPRTITSGKPSGKPGWMSTGTAATPATTFSAGTSPLWASRRVPNAR
ncbi:hypothetical protein AHiyo4_28620 [Arthrobacter sp. Hiyo4]|nr:hypothetical protein AHiyo4_28620 [Arthrobacter sp. Hiyo4]